MSKLKLKPKFQAKSRRQIAQQLADIGEQIAIARWAVPMSPDMDTSADENVMSIFSEVELRIGDLRERMRHIRHAEAGEPTP